MAVLVQCQYQTLGSHPSHRRHLPNKVPGPVVVVRRHLDDYDVTGLRVHGKHARHPIDDLAVQAAFVSGQLLSNLLGEVEDAARHCLPSSLVVYDVIKALLPHHKVEVLPPAVLERLVGETGQRSALVGQEVVRHLPRPPLVHVIEVFELERVHHSLVLANVLGKVAEFDFVYFLEVFSVWRNHPIRNIADVFICFSGCSVGGHLEVLLVADGFSFVRKAAREAADEAFRFPQRLFVLYFHLLPHPQQTNLPEHRVRVGDRFEHAVEQAEMGVEEAVVGRVYGGEGQAEGVDDRKHRARVDLEVHVHEAFCNVQHRDAAEVGVEVQNVGVLPEPQGGEVPEVVVARFGAEQTRGNRLEEGVLPGSGNGGDNVHVELLQGLVGQRVLVVGELVQVEGIFWQRWKVNLVHVFVFVIQELDQLIP